LPVFCFSAQKTGFLSSPAGFVGCRASHKASGSMHRNEPLQAVYKGLSSHFIKSSCVVIWYILPFRQKNTDRPTGKLSFINTVPFCRRYRSITIHLTCLSYHSPIEAGSNAKLNQHPRFLGEHPSIPGIVVLTGFFVLIGIPDNCFARCEYRQFPLRPS
jgi:hypothetical protein